MAKLSERLEYNPETGLFRWKEPRAGQNVVWFTGQRSGNGYFHIMFQLCGQRKRVLAHRLAWLLMTGKWPTEQIDHKNHNGEDNRWENLREATHTQNMRNRITSKNSTTGVCGVNQCLSYSRSPTGQPKFRAVIRINYKNKHLGFFNTLDEAAAARKAAEKKYLGKFAPE